MAAKFAEIFEGHALDNIMFMVQRDMKKRLDYFYLDSPTYLVRYGETNSVGATGEDLPDFAEKTLGRFTNLGYPSFALDPFRGNSTEGEEYVENENRFEALIRVTDADAAAVTRKAVKYGRAFKTVIRGATRSDWLRNITTPQVMPLFISISWEYGIPAKNPNKANEWLRDIDFELSFKFNER